MNKGDNLMGAPITPQAIRDIVVIYAKKLKNKGVAPHDLRRTFAKPAHKGGLPIDQIQISLGHDSIQIENTDFAFPDGVRNTMNF